MTKFTQQEAERAAIIARDYEGIFAPYASFYIHSIEYAAKRSEAAFDAFRAASAMEETADSVFGAIQEALTQAGGLSRFFWPARQSGLLGQARGKRLRRAFELADDSPLSSRAIRNAMEHLDERLDRFLLTDPAGHFFPGPILADYEMADEKIGHVFKLVDPYRSFCVVLGERIYFYSIECEVRRVHFLAKRFILNGALFP
jgi:hypothetical protein